MIVLRIFMFYFLSLLRLLSVIAILLLLVIGTFLANKADIVKALLFLDLPRVLKTANVLYIILVVQGGVTLIGVIIYLALGNKA